MNIRLFRTLPFTLLLMGLFAVPAMARDHHRGGHGKRHDRHHGHSRHHHHHGHHGYHSRGPSFSFGVYSNPYYSPYYARPYHAPYYPAPVVYSQPVYVDRPVVRPSRPVNGSVEVDVQRALARKGYYGGTIDGSIGAQTRAAIRAYQVDRNIPVTGRIDGNLLRSLDLLG